VVGLFPVLDFVNPFTISPPSIVEDLLIKRSEARHGLVVTQITISLFGKLRCGNRSLRASGFPP
jgi:hypothetical protein